MGQDEPRVEGSTHTVRPRWIWVAVALGVLGVVVVGVGVIATSWWVAGPGVALLVVAAAAGLRGNLLYDTHASASAAHPLERVREGETRQAPGSTARMVEPEAHERAEVAARTAHENTHLPHPRRPWWPVGAVVLGLAGVWLAIAQSVYSGTSQSREQSIRSMLTAVVLLVAVLVLRLPGRRPVAWGTCLLVGLALVAFGLWFPHGPGAGRVAELVTGVVVVAGATLAAGKVGGDRDGATRDGTLASRPGS